MSTILYQQITRVTGDDNAWNSTMIHYSTYRSKELLEIVVMLADIRFNIQGINGTQQRSIVDRFSSSEHNEVATIMALPASAYVERI